MSGIVIVTDGSATAAALAKWLGGGGTLVIEARGASDIGRVIAARRQAQLVERTLTVGEGSIAGADFSAEAALGVVRTWLGDTPAIEARTRGDRLIHERLATGAPGSDILVELRTAVGAPPRAGGTKRRGRPTGSDPLRGAGFDVCVELLLDATQGRTERALAKAIGRSPFGVHRVLAELERRRYVERSPTGTTVRNISLLRDDLAESWRERVGLPRIAHSYLGPRPTKARADVVRAATKTGAACLLAGPSAVIGSAASATRQSFFYWNGEHASALGAAGFEPAIGGIGDVVIWPVLERGVLHRPRQIAGVRATNRVVTFLDLVALGTERDRAAAHAVWSEADGG